MESTTYFYHSSHGEIIEDNPIVNLRLDPPVQPFQSALENQEIEIMILNRSAMAHTVRVASVTMYGDIDQNFNPNLFEDYMKITAKGNEIQQIIVGAGGVDSVVFYDRTQQIKKPLPNIEFAYNDDFNMGTFELSYDGNVFTSDAKQKNVWDYLCVEKPENPTKTDYLHSRTESLLDKIIFNVNNDIELLQMMETDDESYIPAKKLTITLFNSTCLHIDNAPQMYEMYPDWGRLFNIYLSLGQQKLAKQHEKDIENIDRQLIQNYQKKKQYETMTPKDPGDAQIQLYGRDRVNTLIQQLNKQKQNKMQKRLRRTMQSTKIKDLMHRDNIKPIKSNIYRRPQKPIFHRQFGGVKFSKIVTADNWKQNVGKPIRLVGKFNGSDFNFYDRDQSGYTFVQELYDYQRYDKLIVKSTDQMETESQTNGYIPIGKLTESGFLAYVRVPLNVDELKQYLHGNLSDIPDDYYHFEYMDDSLDFINQRHFRHRHKTIKNRTYRKGARELMIQQDLPDEVGRFLFENLRIS